jgi:hypothetical protein
MSDDASKGDTVLTDLPIQAWFRDKQEPTREPVPESGQATPLAHSPLAHSPLARSLRRRDVATAHALQAYLQARPRTRVRITLDEEL